MFHATLGMAVAVPIAPGFARSIRDAPERRHGRTVLLAEAADPSLVRLLQRPDIPGCPDASGRADTAVYGYVQVSTDRQTEEGESPGQQERQLAGYAMRHGWALDRVFREEGVSGSVPLGRRPAGARLLAALRPGDAAAAPRLDRLSAPPWTP